MSNYKINQKELNEWWIKKNQKEYSAPLNYIHALALIRENDMPLVDLGCGVGSFLKLLESHYSETDLLGVEASSFAVESKKCNVTVHCEDIRIWKPQDFVQTVTLIDVLEHVRDPKELLEHISSYANNIILVCPNFNFLYARVEVLLGKTPFQNRLQRGGHIYWCNYSELRELFKTVGLQIEKENHLYPWQDLIFFKKIGSIMPSLLAHEFVFYLKRV